MLVDATDGAVLFDAEFPELTTVAAGDLDGDGLDELVVGAGGFIGVMTRDSTSPS
jgi:hypothetical protein